ncbi:F0F1 ATP synthase subunit B [Geitlerinema sp. PCC 9228]|uniref:F0F1 ATP synthase subunit B n=1 Tax=Geitlerinema sp. PCC 9228 TaxID=111611 RepID=UPI0008F9D0E3|nr:F0F1 ATP synthase subunit B [Geitlerinema sp. PCC 9228]
MIDFFLLATEGGFGFNFDPLDTNLVNLAIIIGVLYYFGRQFLGKILSERRANIEEAIQDAERRQKEAADALSQAESDLAQAQAKAEQIRQRGQEQAKAAKEAILEEAKRDVERLKAEASREMETEREQVIAEIRRRIFSMALEKAESEIDNKLDESAQQKLIDRSIAMLGGRQ